MKRNTKKGFTLVELVIVIAVIAILAAVLIPTFGGIIEKANQNAAMQEARNAYTMYLAEYAEEGAVQTEVYVKTSKGWVEIDNSSVVKQEDGIYTIELGKGETKPGCAGEAVAENSIVYKVVHKFTGENTKCDCQETEKQ